MRKYFVVELNSFSVTIDAPNALTAINTALKWLKLKKKEVYYICVDRLK